MKKISISYMPFILSIVFGWLLFFIPTIIYFFKLSSLKYEYDEENLYLTKGFLFKKYLVIPFYTILDIQAKKNFYNYGSILIETKTNLVELKYLKEPFEISNILLKLKMENLSNKDNKIYEII